MTRKQHIKQLCELRKLRDQILTGSDFEQTKINLLRFPGIASITTWNSENRIELELLNKKRFSFPVIGLESVKQCAVTAYLEHIKTL